MFPRCSPLIWLFILLTAQAQAVIPRNSGTERSSSIFPDRRESKATREVQLHDCHFSGSWIVGWLSEDPIGEEGGINLYGYVGNRPLAFLDPLGLSEYPWSDALQGKPMPGDYGDDSADEYVDGLAKGAVATAVILCSIHPGGKVRSAATQVGKGVKADAGKISRALKIRGKGGKGATQQATDALKAQEQCRKRGLPNEMNRVQRSLQEEKAAFKRGEYGENE